MDQLAQRIVTFSLCFGLGLIATADFKVADSGSGEPGADWLAEAQQRIAVEEYHITWQESALLDGVEAAWHAPNRAHALRTYFTPEEIRVIPREGEIDWEWGLSYVGLGRADGLARPGRASIDTLENRIDFVRPELTEWYVNSPDGLKQGFTIDARPLAEDVRSAEVATSPSGTQHLRTDLVTIGLALRGNLTPKFSTDGQAIDFATSGGVNVIHYTDLVVTDIAGNVLPSWMSGLSRPGLHGLRLVFDDRDAVYPVTVDPIATTPAWTAEGNQNIALFGSSVATAGDVNGDGYSDVIVGAQSYDAGQSSEGRAFVYHGSPSGLSTSAAWTAESDNAGADLGTSAATAGDVNGDGYADVIIGAGDYTNGVIDEGAVFLFLGSASGLAGGPNAHPADSAWIAESNQENAGFGLSVATAGDVDGDGYADVIIGTVGYDNGESGEGSAFVYHGSAAGLTGGPNAGPNDADWSGEGNQVSAAYGNSVSTAGDVNGDGYSDVVVGARSFDNGEAYEGRVFVYHGSSGGLSPAADSIVEIDLTNAGLGNAVSTAGDVNGDGYADVIAGAQYYENGQSGEGAAFVYFGSASGISSAPDWFYESNQQSDNFGRAVSTAGDVDGDGYADVIVGSRAALVDNEGRAYVFLGSEAGPSATPDWVVDSNQADSKFGLAVATAGDVNGDGYADVIVGAEAFENGQSVEGRAFVYHGSPSGPGSAPAWSVESNQINGFLGSSVSMAGDVNGDGYSDVIVGAPFYDAGLSNNGRAYVYHGSPSGPPTDASWFVTGDQIQGHMGYSVSAAGDVDGDGYGDVIIGERGYNDSKGRAVVYLGSPSGLDILAAWAAAGEVGNYFGFSVSGAGDVNGDGYADVVVGHPFATVDEDGEGHVGVYLGSPSGPGNTPSWTAEGNQIGAYFGYSVSGAGDVNGDGYSDIIIGAEAYDGGEADEGRAYVYLGSASGPDTTAAWTAESDQIGAEFGFSVSGAGDVDRDGFADVVVGARRFDGGHMDEGRAYVYLGSPSGPDPAAIWTAEGNETDAFFGAGVSTAGDINGDGYSDIVINATDYNLVGEAFIYLGSPSGPAGTPFWSGGDSLTAVSTAGDVNGDGHGDVIAGGSIYENGEAREGGAFIYLGNDGGLSNTPQQRRVDDTAPIGPEGLSDDEDGFRIALLGRTPFGRTRVKLEWEAKPLGVPFDGIETNTSASWTDTGAVATTLDELVTGLTGMTEVHWRVRLLYDPSMTPLAQHSRWLSPPWNGWEETDLRVFRTCDVDRDGFCETEECDDGDPATYPGAPDSCDGTNNDCNDPRWPVFPDIDSDSVEDACDNCPMDPNPDQTDWNGDGVGAACDVDDDGDGIADDDGDGMFDPCTGGATVDCDDNCRGLFNSSQADVDGNGRGDACDFPSPVADIRTTLIPQGGFLDPAEFAEVDGVLYFAATDPANGTELWKSDGTAAGTVLVKDIWAGTSSSSPTELTAVGSTLYFVAGHHPFGRELWISDGTASGTTLVEDIRPGGGSSDPEQLTPMGNLLFFTADDGITDREVWRSEGSAADTFLLLDIAPGFWGSPGELTASNGLLFFRHFTSESGQELWRSDGTSAGTVIVEEIGPGGIDGAPYQLVDVDGTLYFSATWSSHLWKSDGTAAGTELVSSEPGVVYQTTNVDGTLFFTDEDSELWKSDGTAGGTVMVADFGSPGMEELTNVDGTVFFGASYSTITGGHELWKSGGTPAGTVMVKDIFPGSDHSFPKSLTAVGSDLFFVADDGTSGDELWISDGSENGTVRVKDIVPGTGNPSASELTEMGGTLYFAADDGVGGRELWTSNGTEAGTVPVKNVDFGSVSSSPQDLTDLGGTLLFSADNAELGRELWASEGSNGSTALVRDILPFAGSASPEALVELDGTLFFAADDGILGVELWKSDGTLAGTSLVLDVRPGSASSSPEELTIVGNSIFFVADNGTKGDELWITDGTPGGTVLVKDIQPGGQPSWPIDLTAVADELYFTAVTVAEGEELWKSDGTLGGTTIVKDIRPGSDGSGPQELTAVGTTLFFRASETIGIRELWKSDGTAPGTSRVGDPIPQDPFWLTEMGGELFFKANDGTTGLELWRSDGTIPGTFMVKDVAPGSAGSDPSYLTDVGGTLYFGADDSVHGNELWKSDGTSVGTVLVEDLAPGFQDSYPRELTSIGGKLFFAAKGVGFGFEPWESDGTAAGTRILMDIAPGGSSSDPREFTLSGGLVYFSANDAQAGDPENRELWSLCQGPDADGDGFCSALDCNDAAPTVFPGATELCDGVANDCDDPVLPDMDEDLVEDFCDNCPTKSNPNQPDGDGDGIGDYCDNCSADINPMQTNSDTDRWGDACDNCDNVDNEVQTDSDGDGQGDACSLDDDDDGIYDDDGDGMDDPCPDGVTLDCDDNCPIDDNPTQADGDGDGVGDACDNCQTLGNATQDDADLDAIGDECDTCTDTDRDGLGDPGFPMNTCPPDPCPINDAANDGDGDLLCADVDVCPDEPNPDQTNSDNDIFGDACDNCDLVDNPGQQDQDDDGDGNACDDDIDDDGMTNDVDADQDDDGILEDGDFSGIAGDNPCPRLVTVNCDDNCPTIPNPRQADIDEDLQGNVCDFDDGLVGVAGIGDTEGGTLLVGAGATPGDYVLEWEPEEGALGYNVYRGLVSELAQFNLGGCYAADLPGTQTSIPEDPPSGDAFFYLVSVELPGGEGSLGSDSHGIDRVNANPCE